MEPSFQCECLVGSPHEGQRIESGGNIVGYVEYGLHMVTGGRKKSVATTCSLAMFGRGGLIITVLTV